VQRTNRHILVRRVLVEQLSGFDVVEDVAHRLKATSDRGSILHDARGLRKRGNERRIET
jgi:hypothetical protein